MAFLLGATMMEEFVALTKVDASQGRYLQAEISVLYT